MCELDAGRLQSRVGDPFSDPLLGSPSRIPFQDPLQDPRLSIIIISITTIIIIIIIKTSIINTHININNASIITIIISAAD